MFNSKFLNFLKLSHFYFTRICSVEEWKFQYLQFHECKMWIFNWQYCVLSQGAKKIQNSFLNMGVVHVIDFSFFITIQNRTSTLPSKFERIDISIGPRDDPSGVAHAQNALRSRYIKICEPEAMFWVQHALSWIQTGKLSDQAKHTENGTGRTQCGERCTDRQ